MTSKARRLALLHGWGRAGLRIAHRHRHRTEVRFVVVLIVLLIAGVVISWACRPTALSVEAAQLMTIPLPRYEISYPIFHQPQLDRQLRSYAMHQAETFSHSLGERRYDARNTLKVRYAILHHGTRTVSIRFTTTRQPSGGPSQTTQQLLVFDTETGQQRSAADFFVDPAAATIRLRRLLPDYFRQQHPELLTAGQLQRLSAITLADLHEIVPTDDALLIWCNPRDPAVTPERPIAIKKTLLQPVLAPQYAGSDAALTDDQLPPLAYMIETMPRHVATIDPHGKMLALTFDDGPGSLTPRVLDVLQRYDAHATFFVIGRQVLGSAGIVQRQVAEGHEIGNHSWSHPYLTMLPPDRLHQEIIDTQVAIRQATGGYAPVLMRPPYGAVNPGVAAFLRSQGLGVALWNVDTRDWLDRNAQVVYERIMSQAHDGAIILLHDVHPTSVEAAERAIPELVAQGYQLVTMSQLGQYR